MRPNSLIAPRGTEIAVRVVEERRNEGQNLFFEERDKLTQSSSSGVPRWRWDAKRGREKQGLDCLLTNWITTRREFLEASLKDPSEVVHSLHTTGKHKQRNHMISFIRNNHRHVDPFRDLDTWVDHYFGGAFTRGASVPALSGFAAPSCGLRLDIFTDPAGYHVVAELPGVPKEAVELKLEDAVLTIRGEHRTGEGENEETFTFSRSITVGDDVDADAVEAKLENGLLTVSLPRAEARKPKTITVN